MTLSDLCFLSSCTNNSQSQLCACSYIPSDSQNIICAKRGQSCITVYSNIRSWGMCVDVTAVAAGHRKRLDGEPGGTGRELRVRDHLLQRHRRLHVSVVSEHANAGESR